MDDFASILEEIDTANTADDSSDGRMACPDCAKRVSITKAGKPRGHKCAPGGGAEPVTTVRKRGPSTRGKAAMPATVRRLGVAVTAAGVEWSADRLVTNSTGASTPILNAATGAKLTDLPDADMMIGPFLSLLWPSLPPAVQTTLARFSEHEDVIAALFMWAEYGQQIKRYVDAMEEQNKGAVKNVNVQSPSPEVVNFADGGLFDGRAWEPIADTIPTV